MFTTEFEAEVEESESATLHQYYREAMIQGYNFAFEVQACKVHRQSEPNYIYIIESQEVIKKCIHVI